MSLLALCASAWLSTIACAARDLRVAFGQEKAPYLWTDQQQVRGLEYDIVRAALETVGDGLTPAIMPNRRVAIALSGGEFDMVTGMMIGQAGNAAFYSDAYLTYANFAITRRARNIKLNGLADLFDHSVSIWQTAWEDLNLGKLHPAGPSGLDYTEFTSQYRQTRFFWVGRCEVTVIDRNIFLWYSHQLADEMDVSAELDFQNILPPLSVRAAFRDVRDRDAFNAGLKTIRANGRYERIFAQYGLTDPG